jgi:hypothetical protein
MNWFTKLTGIQRETPQAVYEQLYLSEDKQWIHSRANKKAYFCGPFLMPSLSELKNHVANFSKEHGNITVSEVVGDVKEIHCHPESEGALFQVASQFNVLEMTSPDVSPEDGVSRYEYDHTQGPACAIAAGAGTIYRNYFVNVNGLTGQTIQNQLNGAGDLDTVLGNQNNQLWSMENGYLMPTQKGLSEIAKKLEDQPDLFQKASDLLKVGFHPKTQVTVENCTHTVAQVYCSALPVSYNDMPQTVWEPFARLILEAAYEATLCAGIINTRITGNNTVYLTLLGGGAFGNQTQWITDAVNKGLEKYQKYDLKIVFISYGRSDLRLNQILNNWK